MTVDQDDLAKAAFGQRHDHILDEVHHRLRSEKRDARIPLVIPRQPIGESRRDERADSPPQSRRHFACEDRIRPVRRMWSMLFGRTDRDHYLRTSREM